MRRAALAALTLAAAAGIPPPHAPGAQDPETPATADRDDLAELRWPTPTTTSTTPRPGTSYYGDTRFGLGFLRADPDARASASASTPACARSGRPEEDFEFVLASPSRAYLDLPPGGRRTPRFDADFAPPLAPGRLHRPTTRRPTATAARRPRRFQEGDTRELPLRRRHRPRRSAPTRRAPTSSACSPPTSTTPTTTDDRPWCRAARSRARRSGRSRSPRCSRPRCSAATTTTPPTTTTTTRSGVAEADAGLVYEPVGDPAHPRRPRLCRPPPRGDDLAAACARRPSTTPARRVRGDFRYSLPDFTLHRQRRADHRRAARPG